jgi:hypothetical protein
MRYLPFCLLFLTISLSQPLRAQDANYAADVTSIDRIIHALYASISGEKGEPRDWDRFAYLFADGALLTPTRDQDSIVSYQQWTPAEYAEMATDWFNRSGFFEEEIHRVTEQYGPIAHVFSTYTSRRTAVGEIFARGINSIQLLNDGNRWWILSIYWSGESEKHPLPPQYLPPD